MVPRERYGRITAQNPDLDALPVPHGEEETATSTDLVARPPFGRLGLTSRIEDCPNNGVGLDLRNLEGVPKHVTHHPPRGM